MLKRTAIFEEHVRMGGRMVDFGGWELPVQYTGVMDEHLACRSAAGLFDVSHMGEVHVEGPGSEAFLNALVSNDVSKLSIGQAQYTVMCLESGGIVDDLIIYKRAPEKYLVVVNASNTEKDFAHMQLIHRQLKSQAKLENKSAEYSQIAVQGRRAPAIVQSLTTLDLSQIKTYWFGEGTLKDGTPAIIARTGYTGEDGFELYVPWSSGPKVWNQLMEVGRPLGLKPVGLGARDTLRLEMKYPLYGHELSDQTNPLEAALNWVVKLQKSSDFIGKSALTQKQAAGLTRKLVGLKLTERGIPRQGYAVWNADHSRKIGEITSGTQSPSLQTPIGIAYVELPFSEIGQRVSVEIRGSYLSAEIIPTPFYKKPY